MKQGFRTYIKEHDKVLMCGATGTELMKRGGATPGAVNSILMPDLVAETAGEYVKLGAVLIHTNTFSMNPLYAKKNVPDYDWKELNFKAVELGKKAAGDNAFLMANMGPAGGLLKPYGEMDSGEVYDSYLAQAELLAGTGGIDGFCIQTFYHLEDMKLMVKAVHEVCDLPVMASFVFTPQGATMMGDTPLKCLEELLPLGIDTIGHNCGEIDPVTLGDILEPLVKESPVPVTASPNAGRPRIAEDGTPCYDMTPAEFRRGIQYLMEKGVRMLGGCCGVSPAHIEACADLFR